MTNSHEENKALRAEITRLENECVRLTAELMDSKKDKALAKSEVSDLRLVLETLRDSDSN